MSLLHETAIKAKWDGACTLEWATLQSSLPDEPSLQDIPGKSDFQKLKTWAERQDLLLDFDVQLVGFTASIRTVTFKNQPTRLWMSKKLQAAPTA